MRLPFIFSLCIGLMFLGIKPVSASDDYPTGCVIQHGGQTHVYTDYKFTDSHFCRHYSLSADHVIGDLPQQVSISYVSPYKGTCAVDGAAKGANVIINSIEEPGSTPTDHPNAFLTVILLSLVLGSFTFGFYLLR